jgi:hypothetical protein
MTSRWPCTVLAPICCVLAVAPSASAECAWVLWWEEAKSSSSYRTADAKLLGGKLEETKSQSWNILGSYPTNAACESQQAWKIGDLLKQWRKEKAEAKFGEHTVTHEAGTNIISQRSYFVAEYTSSYSTSIRYLCLPDTVDPRGPKGK